MRRPGDEKEPIKFLSMLCKMIMMMSDLGTTTDEIPEAESEKKTPEQESCGSAQTTVTPAVPCGGNAGNDLATWKVASKSM